MATILIIDDKENILRVLKVILEKEGYRVETAAGGQQGLKLAVKLHPDIIISDIRMDDMEGTELFYLLKSRGFNIPFIFITAFASIEGAVSAIKDGAVDYLTKPLDHDYLKKCISRLLKLADPDFPEAKYLVGSSAVMEKLYKRIEAVALSNSTVLISGESGTGKELVARAIHYRSSRKEELFTPVNCSTFSMNLLESELFGYEKGAFTGAFRQTKGFFEIADKGTLFLDEVSELAPTTQAKLLRVLQERSFNRVGGTSFVQVDVRLIAATNRDLEVLVGNGGFRNDLFYRLNVIPIKVPPLRDHLEDLPELMDYQVDRICRLEQLDTPEIDGAFIERLKGYGWPGNVRELENLLERILIINRPQKLEEKHLFEESSLSAPLFESTSTERQRIIKALQLCRGNKTEGAKILAIPRRTLYNRINKYAIQAEEYQSR